MYAMHASCAANYAGHAISALSHITIPVAECVRTCGGALACSVAALTTSGSVS